MHNVIINGKKYTVDDNAPLREPLSAAGYVFPCGGIGRCGKCRINCPDLAPTDLDRRFLSETQLSQGVRLSCDKKITSSLFIECEIPSGGERADIVLHECSISAVITDETVEISIIGDEIVETVVVPSPLASYGNVMSLSAAYEDNGALLTNKLRASIGKNSVELFEKYGAAKAAVTSVAAKGIYLKILAGRPLDADEEELERAAQSESFGLPTESLYLLPTVGDLIGGELLAESIKLKDNSLLIDCERTVSFIRIGEKDNLSCAVWDCDYSPLALRCIVAAAKFLSSEAPRPAVYLYGKYAYAVEEALADALFTVYHREKSPESTASALISFRTRSKLLKEQARTTFIRLYDNEAFQQLLSQDD